MTVKAHFDGKVIVPDEPIDLPLNERLIVRIERTGEPQKREEEPALNWLAANAVDDETLPADLANQHDHYLYGCPMKDKRS